MRVEDAITSAKSYVEKVFAGEDVSQLRLEEVEFDEGERSWAVTISMMRPAQALDKWSSLVAGEERALQRVYRTVRIDDAGARLPSVKIRPMHEDG